MAEEKKVKKDRGRWFREMRSELKKVVWPTPEKVAKNTGTVILYSVLIGACIWAWPACSSRPSSGSSTRKRARGVCPKTRSGMLSTPTPATKTP